MKNIKIKQVQFLEKCNVWCAMLTLRYNWETNQPKALDSTVEVDKIKGDWSSRQCHNFFWKYLYGHITDTLPQDTWSGWGRGSKYVAYRNSLIRLPQDSQKHGTQTKVYLPSNHWEARLNISITTQTAKKNCTWVSPSTLGIELLLTNVFWSESINYQRGE